MSRETGPPTKVVVPEDIWWDQWRLVLTGVATLEEIETHYSLADVVRANAALNVKQDLEKEAYDNAKRKGGAS